jgi:hypothetical protein
MLDFLTAPANLPFAVALSLMALIAALEGVTTALGAGASSFLESVLPGVGADMDANADVAGDAGGAAGHGPLTSILGWLRIGELPVLILLVLWLTMFGLVGLGLQCAIADLTGRLLPASVAWLPALLLSLPPFRVTSGWLARLLPKDETSAVSHMTFIGRLAIVVLGTARHGAPAQAALRDVHGRKHYVMVEPKRPEETFEKGESVLLVSLEGAKFKVVRPPRELALPESSSGA